MKFCDIPGHEDVKRRLREIADADRIPHAILLEGPAGIGKHALARAFVQYVGCRNRKNGEPCGTCSSCLQHQALQQIDTIFSFPVVKRKTSSTSPTISNDYLPDFIEFATDNPFMDEDIWLEKLGSPNTKPVIYVDEANELIRRLSYASHSAKYKSVIIWQADKLNESASNKLLKLIEEPPGETIIIMTTAHPANILPTIYSRVQRIKVKRLNDDVLAQWLVDNDISDVPTASELAPLALGSVTETMRLLSRRDDSSRFLDYFISMMRLAYQRDISSLKDLSTKIAAEKRDTIVSFLEYMARMLRENFIANLHDSSLNLMLPKESEFSRNFSRFVNEKNVASLYEATCEAIEDIRANANPKIVLFDLVITVILKLKQ